MNEIVRIINNEAVTTTLAIAEGVDRPHHGIIQLVRQHQVDFEEFGRVAFEMRLGEKLPQGGFGASTEYAILNQHQAVLLMTYMRNTEVIREFKKALITAFFRMAEKLQQRTAQTTVFFPLSDVPMADRPVAIPTDFGFAYINHATYFLCANAARNPESKAGHQLVSALFARTAFNEQLPEPFRTAERLRRELLRQNPLWSDIMQTQRLGLTTAASARVCGCHPSTYRKHLRKMEACGLFNDLLSELVSGQLGITTGPEGQ